MFAAIKLIGWHEFKYIQIDSIESNCYKKKGKINIRSRGKN